MVEFTLDQHVNLNMLPTFGSLFFFFLSVLKAAQLAQAAKGNYQSQIPFNIG